MQLYVTGASLEVSTILTSIWFLLNKEDKPLKGSAGFGLGELSKGLRIS
jgi:hypothetical protein